MVPEEDSISIPKLLNMFSLLRRHLLLAPKLAPNADQSI